MAAEPTLEQQIKTLLVERLFLKVEPEAIEDADALMETLGVDSVGLLEVVVGLEEVFGVTFEEDEEFNVDRFRTVRDIAAYVREKVGGADSGA
jgi:acyl carrier protein